MALVLWVFRGVCADYSRWDLVGVTVFGRGVLIFLRIHYIACLTSMGLSLGQFVCIPILVGGFF